MPSPVKAAAVELGLEVTDDLSAVGDVDVDLAIVVAYGRIIPTSLLERVPMVNLHFSLLPRWRGAAPVERAILAGDDVTGVCVMAVAPELDTGDAAAGPEARCVTTTPSSCAACWRCGPSRSSVSSSWPSSGPRCSSTFSRSACQRRSPRRARSPTRPRSRARSCRSIGRAPLSSSSGWSASEGRPPRSMDVGSSSARRGTLPLSLDGAPAKVLQ